MDAKRHKAPAWFPASLGTIAVTAVAILIFCIGLWALHRLAAEISWHAVKADIHALPVSVLLASAGFTALSYLSFALYDVVALRIAAPGRVPVAVAMYTGVSGYAIANLLGFSWITGAAVRARIYSGYKLDMAVIGSVIASIWIFFWGGIFLLLGVMLLFHAQSMAGALPLSPVVENALGIAIIAGIGGVLIWLSLGFRVIEFRSFRFQLPGPKTAVTQIGLALLDVTGSALALYVLLPTDVASNFPVFFVVYVAAIVFGIISHAPGGIGIFEATVIAGLGTAGRSDVLASLVIYRVIYYVMPFCIAALALGFAWSLTNGKAVGSVARQFHRAVTPLIPALSAGLALLAGTILLLSGSLPAETSRLRLLETVLPLSFVEVSHLIGSITGILLIVVARGLYRKQYRAWMLSSALIGLGIIVSLLKGIDWEETVSLTFLLAVLVSFRSAFYRAANQSVLMVSWRWVFVSLALLAMVFWVGLFAYSHVAFSNELWWRFAWDGDAPRYLRASVAAAIILAAVTLNSMLNTTGRRLPAEPIPDIVRALVAASTNAEANIFLTGDKRFLVSADEKACLAYADSGRSLITKGDPVGHHGSGEKLIWKLREQADRFGKRCVFYAVRQEYLPTYLDMGFSILKIGEVGRVVLPEFTLEGSAKKDFRYAKAKAAREGYVFGLLRREDLPESLANLRSVSDAWLLQKHGKEKQFALGAFNEAYLSNFDNAVIRRMQDGRIVAFANLHQSAEKEELSIDLMRYDPECPGYIMDALFGELLLWGKAQGYQWFSLGAAPLAGFEAHPLAPIWSRIGNLIYEHGEHFYHFEGLRSFKQKFDPVWSPNYLAVPRGLDAPQVMIEINGLISGGITGILK